MVATIVEVTGFYVNGDAAVVSNVFVAAGKCVEQRRFSTIGISSLMYPYYFVKSTTTLIVSFASIALSIACCNSSNG